MAATTIIARSVYDFPTVATLRQSLCEPSVEHPLADWKLDNYDEGSTVSSVNNPNSEAQRLLNLLSYNLLDSCSSDPEMDELTTCAKDMLDAPIAAITVIDLGRQWFKSIQGLDAKETPRNVAFCAHTIQRKQECGALIVPDTTKDERFQNNPFVTGPPAIRFYAGVPIRCPNGEVLAVLCVLDTKPRPEGLTRVQLDSLDGLADCAMANILMS